MAYKYADVRFRRKNLKVTDPLKDNPKPNFQKSNIKHRIITQLLSKFR